MQPLLKQFQSFLKNSRPNSTTITKPLTHSSIKNYVSDINHFLSWLAHSIGQKTIKPDHINSKTCQAYKNFLQQKTPPATANRRLSSLRRFTAFLAITQLAPNDPAQALTNLEKPPPPLKITYLTSNTTYYGPRKTANQQTGIYDHDRGSKSPSISFHAWKT